MKRFSAATLSALLLAATAGGQDLFSVVNCLTSQLGTVGEYRADVFIKYT